MEDTEFQKMTQAELDEVIRKHNNFMTARPGGARAVVKDKDLSGLSFAGKDLSQSDFTGCIMENADLTNSNFESATLFGCDFTNSKLNNARMVRADMRGAEISQADLSKADMTGTDLREGKTIVKRRVKNPEDRFDSVGTGVTQFIGSNLSDANLNGATAASADFTDANMQGAQLQSTDLKNAMLLGADLSKADLSSADLRNADFSYATMVGANMKGTEKSGTTFSLTLTVEPVGKDFAEVEMTLDELLLKHVAWVASGGRQGGQLDLTGMDMRKAPSLAARKLTAIKASQATFAEM
ncbi:MAG: pentapeptide repeat-containing protein, partial [Alphaproteobacteria bacterium]|nr:pentapeptide repeat-containing protein [Alphaproteobacteria bacterium]